MAPQNSKHWQLPFGNYSNFVNHPGAADIEIHPKSPEFHLDMRYFCNLSLVSLGIRPRSRRCAERTRQGEGRSSRPPQAALERSYLTETSSSANRILSLYLYRCTRMIFVLYICLNCIIKPGQPVADSRDAQSVSRLARLWQRMEVRRNARS